MSRNHTTLFILTFLCSSIFAQSPDWVRMMKDPHQNIYEVKNEYDKAWNGVPYEKGSGRKQFERWYAYWEPRLYPSGDFPDVAEVRAAHQDHDANIARYKSSGKTAASNWTPMGPDGMTYGLGRVNVIEVDPADANTIYIGTPSGGAWKTTNAGGTWTPLSDDFPTITCSGIDVNPRASNVVYMSTGDFNHWQGYGTGVYKSLDGGANWSVTGLSWAVTDFWRGGKIEVNSSDTSIVLCASDDGLYRTTNGGTTWTRTLTGDVEDFEFKPGDPNTVYAVNTGAYKSTDGGATWTAMTTGLPAAGWATRLQLAVTPANPNVVYVVAGGTATESYKSTNNGASFTAMHDGSTGNPLTSQVWYDMACELSPTNENDLYAGGISAYRSTNSGNSYTTINTGLHADKHWLKFFGSWLYCGCDGGIYRSSNNGSTWINLTPGLQITQYYKFSNSAINTARISAGSQDNGTHRRDGPSWTRYGGGDGMDTEIDYTDPDIIYYSSQYGYFRRTNDGGSTSTSIFSGLGGTGAWVTPIHIDPNNHNTVYVAYDEVWKSTDAGATSTAISSLGASNLDALEIAKSNSDYIYTSDGSTLYRTTNGGTSWNTISSGLPSGSISYIEVHPSNPDRVWVTKSSWSAGSKVFETTDGGSNWTNISTGLPNFPANCITYQEGSSWDGLYVGLDVGVYYRDNATGGWIPFMTDLPNVQVSELEIVDGTNKIRAATFGRGVWESDVERPVSATPQALFSSDDPDICPGTQIQFYNNSINYTSVVRWDFPGGTPSTSTDEDPLVTYSTSGTYNVTLIVTNGSANDTIISSAYVNVGSVATLDLEEGFPAAAFPADWKILNPDGLDTWQTTATVGGYGVNDGCIWINNYSYSGSGNLDYFNTPTVDFTSTITPQIQFDVAYAPFSTSLSDTLVLYYSTDCGQTLNKIYEKGGATLATAPSSSTSFTPGATEWRTDSVDLAFLIPIGEVKFYFENRGYYGNNLYVDNINILSGGLLKIDGPQIDDLRIYPNPTSGRLNITTETQQLKSVELFDMTGRRIPISNDQLNLTTNVCVLDMSKLSAGIYLISIQTDKGKMSRKVSKY